MLLEKYPQKKIVLSGSREEAVSLKKYIDVDTQRVICVAGKATVTELICMLKENFLYVGNDTGITHLACMLGVRSIVFAHAGTTKMWLPIYGTYTDVHTLPVVSIKRKLYPYQNVTPEFVRESLTVYAK